jgi:S-adenosylmethionine synthetase
MSKDEININTGYLAIEGTEELVNSTTNDPLVGLKDLNKIAIPKVNPLLVLRGIEGIDFELNIAYVPRKIEDKYDLIDKEKEVPTILKELSKMGEEHLWDVYMIEKIADTIESLHNPIALYILAVFDETGEWPESVVSIIRGEMIKDWDLKMEALHIIGV